MALLTQSGSRKGESGGVPARIAIVSSVRLVRDGVSAMLRDCDFVADLHVSALDEGGIAEIKRSTPDLILVDLAGTDAAMIARRLKSACPQAKLVSFALAELDENVFACAAAGFVAYVAKEADAAELQQTIIDALQGRTRIAAALFARLASQREGDRETAALLTPRESEVLALARRGYSNKTIARDLLISPATVKNHMHNILNKLQVSGRGEAVAKTTPAGERPRAPA